MHISPPACVQYASFTSVCLGDIQGNMVTVLEGLSALGLRKATAVPDMTVYNECGYCPDRVLLTLLLRPSFTLSF